MTENGYNEEEMKMVKETKKIWDTTDVAITATCIRVPIMRAHAESINLEFDREVSEDEVRHAELCFALPSHAVLCFTEPSCAMLCRAICAVLCFAKPSVLCCAVLWCRSTAGGHEDMSCAERCQG